MKIAYADAHSWSKPITEEIFANYGKSDAKRIKKAIDSADELSLSYKIEPANEHFFRWFQPMYENAIRSRINPRPAKVYEVTSGNTKKQFPFYTLTVKENDTPVGGCIFSDRGSHFSIAYRIYEPKWTNDMKIASPAMYGEFQLDTYSLMQEKTKLVHGQDRNPYGVNSNIGLAIFKLAVGCSAMTPPTHEKCELETDSLNTDALVLQYPDQGRHITKAVLVATEHTQERYTQIHNYSHRLQVDVITRDPS